jgi:hypothetical protein
VTALGVRFSEDKNYRLVEIEANLATQIYGVETPWPPGGDFLKIVRDYAEGKHLFLCWGGNEHADFIIESGPAFDFVSSELPTLPLCDGAILVPQALVEARFAALKASLRSAVEFLKAGCTEQISLLGTPPPKGDYAKLRSLICGEPVFRERAEEMGLDPSLVPLTSPTVLLKLWALHQRLRRQVAEDFGLRFVEAPAAGQNDQGFLKEEYWRADVTHANHAYGALVLAAIVRAMNDAHLITSSEG